MIYNKIINNLTIYFKKIYKKFKWIEIVKYKIIIKQIYKMNLKIRMIKKSYN